MGTCIIFTYDKFVKYNKSKDFNENGRLNYDQNPDFILREKLHNAVKDGIKYPLREQFKDRLSNDFTSEIDIIQVYQINLMDRVRMLDVEKDKDAIINICTKYLQQILSEFNELKYIDDAEKF